MNVLDAQNIVSGYGEMEILHGVSMVVDPGEMVAIIGPNGAGKSTMMKAIFGLLKVKVGKVLLNGKDVTGKPPQLMVRDGVQYVPQTDNVFPTLSIDENLEMGAFVRGEGTRDRKAYILDLFPDLKNRTHEKAGRLSGGQRQMLALARALMLDPTLLLLDEPTAGLSPRMVGDVFQKIMDINQHGVATLIVEQNAREALQACHRAYILVTGRNALDGTGPALLANDDVKKLYLGG